MRLYLLPVMGMCFAVDGLLLGAAGAFMGRKTEFSRTLLAAALGALHAGGCLIPQMQNFDGYSWRIGMLLLMGLIAFGSKAWGSVAVFAILDLAAGALALGMKDPAAVLLSGLAVTVLAVVAIKGKRSLVPVELCWGDKRERVLALRDTGNGLIDPITGEQVLIVGPEVAGKLTGLSKGQLQAPLETLAQRALPGLRLIPCATVNGKGILLALRFPRVRIGGVQRSAVVAFAAEGLGRDGGFEALMGGI